LIRQIAQRIAAISLTAESSASYCRRFPNWTFGQLVEEIAFHNSSLVFNFKSGARQALGPIFRTMPKQELQP
jgi:hypothetical protein